MCHPQGGTGLSFPRVEGYEPPAWPEEPGRQQKMIHLDVQVTPRGGDGRGGAYAEEEGQAALETAARLALSVGGT
jgi:hypothetical protein